MTQAASPFVRVIESPTREKVLGMLATALEAERLTAVMRILTADPTFALETVKVDGRQASVFQRLYELDMFPAVALVLDRGFPVDERCIRLPGTQDKLRLLELAIARLDYHGVAMALTHGANTTDTMLVDTLADPAAYGSEGVSLHPVIQACAHLARSAPHEKPNSVTVHLRMLNQAMRAQMPDGRSSADAKDVRPATRGVIRIARALIEYGARADTASLAESLDACGGITNHPLMGLANADWTGCEREMTLLMKEMVNAGLDLNTPLQAKNLAVWHAAAAKNVPMLFGLVECGADFSPKRSNGVDILQKLRDLGMADQVPGLQRAIMASVTAVKVDEAIAARPQTDQEIAEQAQLAELAQARAAEAAAAAATGTPGRPAARRRM